MVNLRAYMRSFFNLVCSILPNVIHIDKCASGHPYCIGHKRSLKCFWLPCNASISAFMDSKLVVSGKDCLVSLQI